MECSSCGEPVEPGQLSCPACGALTVLDDPAYIAVANDPPTEVMPAIERPDVANADEASNTPPQPGPDRLASTTPSDRTAPAPLAGPIAPAAPARSTPPAVTTGPARDSTLSVESHDATPVRHERRSRPELLVAGVAVAVAVVALLVAGLAMRDDLAGLFGPVVPSGAVAADESPLSVEETGDPTDLPPEEGFACSPQTFSAPETGKWRLYRTEFGRRGQSDYLRLKLRRDGGHDQAATVTAEVVPPDEVSSRYNVEPPGDADSVVVIAFNGPVNTGSSWNARPGYGALRGFEVKRGRESNVHVVVAAAGEACFRLSATDWQAGRMSDQTDIAVQIQRR